LPTLIGEGGTQVAMYAEERQDFILELARREGRVDAAALADELGVASETIRRDLKLLERQELLKRTHGGAIPVHRLGFDPLLATRGSVMVAEKEQIAKAALDEVPTEGAILIDSGSTTALFAKLLPHDRPLTVVTNAPAMAVALLASPLHTVLTTGGRLRQGAIAEIGEWAQRSLADISVDVAFIGTNGITVGRGLTTTDQAEAATKRSMVACARRVVVLADHSKIGVNYFFRFAELQDVDLVITDSGIDPDLAADIKNAGPGVRVA
jgi:DeoR family fructose operon transcriptional repressor